MKIVEIGRNAVNRHPILLGSASRRGGRLSISFLPLLIRHKEIVLAIKLQNHVYLGAYIPCVWLLLRVTLEKLTGDGRWNLKQFLTRLCRRSLCSCIAGTISFILSIHPSFYPSIHPVRAMAPVERPIIPLRRGQFCSEGQLWYCSEK